MRLFTGSFLILALILPVQSGFALAPGQDVLVPAAGRVASWVTDLVVMNPGETVTTVTIAWLVRGQANADPATVNYILGPGETLILDDVILDVFGQSTGNGAFRVTADQAVVVNSRIYSQADGETFGQGFEGVPVGLATAAGGWTDIVGLSSSGQFRTNVYGCAAGDGASLVLSLLAPDGTVLATTTKNLQAWMPFLNGVDTLMGVGSFEAGSLRVEVTAGAAVVGASKVDNESTDPTTLEGTAGALGAGTDGVYQFAVYDSDDYSTGGNLVVEGGALTALLGTYTNWDKIDGGGEPECTWQFKFGRGLATPVSLEDLADGVEFTEDHTDDGLGMLTYTLTLEVTDNLSVTGTVDAVGSEFSGADDGCNGVFPPLTVYGGKLPVD